MQTRSPQAFSLAGLLETNPALAESFLSKENPSIAKDDELWVNIGCGARVFGDFTNIDIIPQHPDVIKWNLLDLWPSDLEGTLDGVFSEDCLEHFFLNEQLLILCNLNWGVRSSACVRILMPNLSLLLKSYFGNSSGLFITRAGIETAADQLNHGMRMEGHRWIHDSFSFARLAALSGFSAQETNCSDSAVEKLRGRNLRDEKDSASFATELRKTRNVKRLLLKPSAVDGAELTENIGDYCTVYRSLSRDPRVHYSLPRAIGITDIACLNFRSSNLSCWNWDCKRLNVDGSEATLPLDESLKSQHCVNVVTARQLAAIFGESKDIGALFFSPASFSDQYFTVGPCEVFFFT
jgi:hypothetical protein